ncbi:MAG: tetratricopeptide repeat protein [Nitrosopumilus sp. B06]|nr:MAG: tetratricopeptide repeat protein [Nitrosopumilus sp. B06]
MALSYDVRDKHAHKVLTELFEEGNSLVEQGKHKESAACFDKAVLIKPDYKKFLDRGISLAKSGKHDEALRCLDGAIDFKADFSGLFYQQGVLLDKHGLSDMALKCYDKANKVRDTGFEIFFNKGVSLNSLKRYEESTRCFDEAIRIKYDSAETFNHMGVAMWELDKYEDAMTYFDTALMMTHNYHEAFFNKGRLLDALGTHYKAVHYFDEVVRIKPDFYEALFHRGVALAHMSKHKDAVKSFDDFLRVRPDHFEALCHKAHSLYRLGLYAEAIKYYDAAMETRPDVNITSKRDALLERQTNVPERMWLPLLVLKNTGEFRNKTLLQNIVFLVQHELDVHDYDFASHGFGPYSDEFVLDVSSNPELITVHLYNDDATGEYRLAYLLTEKGQEQLSKFEKFVGNSTIKEATACICKYKDLKTEQLLGDVYSKFAFEQFNLPARDEIIKNLKMIGDSINDADGKYETWPHVVVGAIIETVGSVLSNLDKAQNNVQKNTIFNTLKVIIHKCKDIEKYLAPPVDSDFLRPILSDLDEHTRLLLEYCDANKIMKNPYSLPLSELFTEDEARRLTKALSEEDIPA